jgi:hypothetical protein
MVVSEQNGFRELTTTEIELVSGGDLMDSYAFRGGAIGGMLGSIFGAGFTGSSAGAGGYGAIGAALGFSFGLGWGVGTLIYEYATTHRK